MAQMGLGYGSEWQLLRFLGHHRDFLNKQISAQTGIVGNFHWLDFEFSESSKVISGDSEIKGISFIKSLGLIDQETYEALESEYKSYKIERIESWQSWDAILVVDKALYLIEAKARAGELSVGLKNGGGSAAEILRYMRNLLPGFPVSEIWMGKYYQLANRLATTSLLNKHLNPKGVSVRTMTIYFVNGYQKRVLEGEKSYRTISKDASKDNFKTAIFKEREDLGINNCSLDGLMTSPVFIDCLGNNLHR